MTEYEKIKEVKGKARDKLFKIPGVTGIGIGLKQVKGKATKDLSIRVSVSKKKKLEELKPEEVIPKEIEGIKTDVIEEAYTEIEMGPFKGGIQIEGDGTGTLGCFALTVHLPSEPVLLSNQHVLLPGTTTNVNNEKVSQPCHCTICSACCSDVIGNVADALLDDDVDGAIARLKPGVKWMAEIKDIGVIGGTYDLGVSDVSNLASPYQVQKTGRTTGHTTGNVTDIDWDGTINQHDGTLHRHFIDSIRIEPGTFSAGGDSGSAIVNNDNRIVGLLFGGGKDADGNKTCTYACHIRHVQNGLDIQVATATSSGVVNTVPGAANPSSSTVTATAGTEVNMNPRVTASRNQMEALQQAEKDIMETHDGRLFYGLYKKHLDEVRYLINHNRKVATVWHRNGGPAFINRLIYSAEFPEEEFPHTINGLSVRESMKRIGDIFRKYGGESLREDMEKYGAVVTSICGMTYSRVLQKMREGNLFSELAIRPTLLNRRGNT